MAGVMTTPELDTAAIRAAINAARWPTGWQILDLCDALDAARTEQLSAIREAVGDCCGYRTRAEAAEARIAAALELCEEFRRGEYDVQPAIAVERFRRALTGGTDG